MNFGAIVTKIRYIKDEFISQVSLCEYFKFNQTIMAIIIT